MTGTSITLVAPRVMRGKKATQTIIVRALTNFAKELTPNVMACSRSSSNHLGEQMARAASTNPAWQHFHKSSSERSKFALRKGISTQHRFLHSTTSSHAPRGEDATSLAHSVFRNESHLHEVADETLEQIEDAIGVALEDIEEALETNLASGVLTMSFGSHGTWVLNKQTPNRQIWWSSPISGPRRYEFVIASDAENGNWAYTRREGGIENASKDILHSAIEDEDTILHLLAKEIHGLYGVTLAFDV
jgi:frataxin